jgi:uncharacterized membrane protein YgcG
VDVVSARGQALYLNLAMQIKTKTVLLGSLMMGFSVLGLGITPGWAIPVQQVQNPHALNAQNWVSDQTNKLSQNAKDSINSKLTTLEKESGVEVAVAIVPDMAPETQIEPYAKQLFNQWKIGKAATNNGILILWSPGEWWR